MKPYGWAYMMTINSLEGVNNPRPIIVECLKQNKSGILHYVLGTRKSACGQATFLSSFMGGESGESTIIRDIHDDSNQYVKYSLVCPACEEYCDKNEVDKSEE